MKTDRHFVFPSVCLFCLRLANCIMKMSINFPTICRQTGVYVCHSVLPPSSHSHTHILTRTHSCLSHSMPIANWVHLLAANIDMTDTFLFYFICIFISLFAYSISDFSLSFIISSFFFCFSIFIQLHLWRLVPWPSPKTFANHVFAFISLSSTALPAPDVPLPGCICVCECVCISVSALVPLLVRAVSNDILISKGETK